jgi:hypothetical protein
MAHDQYPLNSVPATFEEIPEALREHIEHQRAYDSLPGRYVMSMAAAADSPFPYRDGDVTVLGPETFISEDGETVAYKGQHYRRMVSVSDSEVIPNEMAMTISYKGQNYVLQAEAEEYKASHQRACETIAQMYEAGTGRKGQGPIRGVVEDVRDARGADLFRTVFASQDKFQRLLGHDLSEYDEETKAGYLKDQILALLDEAHEALNEVGWKPWASSRHVNHKEFAGELADVLCFLVNLALGVGLSADDLFALHQEKVLRNIKRQEDKYDGVSGKCPGCKRAIDDLRAKGLPVGNFGGVDYCSPECIEKVNGPRPSLVHGTDVPFHNTQES